MAGISNGISLHGSGLISFAATFLIFSDYMKNSMKFAALSHAGVVYILTHDSTGLGEDGPTHQPVEQPAGLRAVPNLLVLRPADGNETAGAYKVAINYRDGPSVIALSRQKLAANLAGTNVMNIILVAAECTPWSKTAGLGDVAGALPESLARRGHRVMVVAPRYGDYQEATDAGVCKRYKIPGQVMEVR